ncbi:MAG: hypothetical protein ACHQUB_02920 [Candidatus Saccharimonadia bacterium]
MSKLKKRFHHLRIPPWLAMLYGILAALLIPWTITLSYALPYRHVSSHWDVAWVGFDILLLLAIALTAYFAVYRSGWIVLSAMATSTLLFVDAWLDIWTSRPGSQMQLAIAMAIFVEIPLALISFWLAERTGRQLISRHDRA